MPKSQLPSASSQPHSLSDEASNIVYRIPQLVRRLRDLESEEAELDTRARQLVEQEQLPKTRDQSSTLSRPNVTTPISKPGRRAGVDRGVTSTPHFDPRTIETPMKSFLLMESFSLVMSIKSKRKGRIFLAGDSTEFGERK